MTNPLQTVPEPSLVVHQTTAKAVAYTGAQGTMTFCQEDTILRVHDGVTRGGVSQVLGSGSVVDETQGGTGQNVFAQGDLLYASAINTLARLPKNATNQRVLTNGGASNSPAWGQVNMATGVTGALPVVNGGTGGVTVADARANLGLGVSTYPLIDYGGIALDGSTTYIDNAALANIADSKVGSFFTVIRFAGAASAEQIIFNSSSDSIKIARTATGELLVSTKDNSAVVNLSATTNTTPLATAGTYVIALSYNLATATFTLYINDVAQTVVPTTLTDSTINYTVAEYSIGAGITGTSKVTGDIYAVWFTAASVLSFSAASVRRSFTDANNTPVFLGFRGELPTGTAPIIYLGLNNSSSWHINRGTGTGASFKLNGTIANASTELKGQNYRYAPNYIGHNMTIRVPDSFSTLQAAWEWLGGYLIAPGVEITIEIAAGTYTHTAPLMNHPQGNQIIIQGATASYPAPADFVITGSSVGQRATDNANHLTMLQGKYPTKVNCDNTIAIDWREGTPCPTVRDILWYTSNSSSVAMYLYSGLAYFERLSFHGWSAAPGIALTNGGQLRGSEVSCSGMGGYGVQVSDESSWKMPSGTIMASNLSTGFFGKRAGSCEAYGLVSKGNGGHGVEMQDGGGCLECATAILTQNALDGARTALGGDVSVNFGFCQNNLGFGVRADSGKIQAQGASITGNALGGVYAVAGGLANVKNSDISSNVGVGVEAIGIANIVADSATVRLNTGVGVKASYGAVVYAILAISEGNSYGFHADLAGLIIAASAQALSNTQNGFWATNRGRIIANSAKAGESGKPNNQGVLVDSGGFIQIISGNVQFNASRGLYCINGDIIADSATVANNVGAEIQVTKGSCSIVGVAGLVAADITGYWDELNSNVKQYPSGFSALQMGTDVAVTISGGSITATGNNMVVDTEAAAASDDLDTIVGGVEGSFLLISAANSARTVVIKNGTGNIFCGADISLDNALDVVMLVKKANSSNWYAVAFNSNGA